MARTPVQLPPKFRLLNGVQPDPERSGDGFWYLNIYGKFDGNAEMTQHVFRWRPGMVAERVGPAEPTDARGSTGQYEAGLALFSFEGTDLYYQDVPGFTPRASGTSGGTSDAALAQRVANLELKLSQLQAGASQDSRVPGILTRLSAVEGVAAKANERGQNALTQLGKLVIPPAGVSRDEAWQLAIDAIEEKFKQWVGYKADPRLLNLLWDRAVKLLRYKEQSGKTAAQLPINDPKNLEV